MKRKTTFGLVALTAMALAGCGTTGGPDEFRVVRKAPLTVPPEYNLRPPTLGQASRIPGVTPAAVAVIAAHIDRGSGARLL